MAMAVGATARVFIHIRVIAIIVIVVVGIAGRPIANIDNAYSYSYASVQFAATKH